MKNILRKYLSNQGIKPEDFDYEIKRDLFIPYFEIISDKGYKYYITFTQLLSFKVTK